MLGSITDVQDAAIELRLIAFILDYAAVFLFSHSALFVLAMVLALVEMHLPGYYIFSYAFRDYSSWVIYVVTIFFYYGWSYSKNGSSVGKHLVGISVIQESPRKYPDYFDTFLREAVGKILLFPLLPISFYLAISSGERRMLHDRLCGTRVVMRRGD